MALKIKRTSREMEEIPLASTADIAFLLIVFFLAASALLELRGVRLPLPRKNAPPMQVLKKNVYRIKIDARGRFLRENKALGTEELARDILGAKNANSKLIVIVNISPNAPSESAPRIVKLLRDVRVHRFSLGMDRK